jgi:hypothetical protein
MIVGDLVPVHVDVFAGAELSPAQGARLQEAARYGGSTRWPDHLLEDYVRRVRVPPVLLVVVAVAACVVLMVHEDLEADDQALAPAATGGAAVAGHGRAEQAASAARSGTFLPEMEDALFPWKHGGGGGGIDEWWEMWNQLALGGYSGVRVASGKLGCQAGRVCGTAILLIMF